MLIGIPAEYEVKLEKLINSRTLTMTSRGERPGCKRSCFRGQGLTGSAEHWGMKGKRLFMATEEEDTERTALLSGRGDPSVSASCCDPAPPLCALSIICCLALCISLCVLSSMDEQILFTFGI